MHPLAVENLLELRNLDKNYGEVRAVRDASLNIKDGEFLTLLGPSGSGKTTILMMIAGFEYPTQGEVVLQGKPINLIPPERRDIGMVFQNYALFPHMTIFENIAFPLKMRKTQKSQIPGKITEVLELVQLGGYEKRYPKQLSGGQQQRIALARAVVFNPPVLLMDEPLGALDKKLREHMQLELKRIQSQLKRTVVYVTHDQEEALVMSDRIAVMDEGQIQQVGAPDELYERPANKFVAGFIGESNFIEGRVVDRKEEIVTIQLTEGSKHQIRWAEALRVGEEVCFSIRPEKAFIVTGERPSDIALDGVVREVIYVGETTRYKIAIDSEHVVNVREMNIGAHGRAKEGDKVKISWNIEHLRKL
jgi:putative spermidine/putrescine transport system ATP-binding protein